MIVLIRTQRLYGNKYHNQFKMISRIVFLKLLLVILVSAQHEYPFLPITNQCRQQEQKTMSLPDRSVFLRPAPVIMRIQCSNKTLTTNPKGNTCSGNLEGASELILTGNTKSKYLSKSYHFHSPSIHAIGGKSAKLEMHFVHDLDPAYKSQYTSSIIVFLFDVTAKNQSGPLDYVDFTSTGNLFNLKNLLGYYLQRQMYNIYESVVCGKKTKWYILSRIIPVTQKTLQKFFNLLKIKDTDKRIVHIDRSQVFRIRETSKRA